MSQNEAELLSVLRAQFPAQPPRRLGIAVSGGSDSIALLHLAKRCFSGEDFQLFAATVDHGLRPEAVAEAEWVARVAADIGVAHETLIWKDWDGTGNLQDQARRARYSLLTEWARRNQIETVALAHTADDQAETVLMRLGRAAGVSGLAAIPKRRMQDGVVLVRPLLGVTRAALREFLTAAGLGWCDDPSNENTRYDRIKARKALATLQPLGLDAQVLSEVASNMARAREALDWYTFLAARDLAVIDAGDVMLDLRGFRTLPDEIARRLLLHAVCWIRGGEYPPRRAAVAAVMSALRQEKSAQLHGCLILNRGRRVWICREFKAVEAAHARLGELWDGRWVLSGPVSADAEIRALGPGGLARCPEWRNTGRPYAALQATPAVWRGDDLIAAPLAGMPGSWTARLKGGEEDFYASLLSH
ncbi:tRNA lysidine(34) synthetase TilS [Ruegeria marina]|uniref:tRNA(Ile)-lysidine synthase n=1 Tax=Ruegeria marina TaxID=639004 RepID=A0A1G6TMI8_9RHOB|nr:tRNA(Ile)-lysidine synthase [Ruegeria marina]